VETFLAQSLQNVRAAKSQAKMLKVKAVAKSLAKSQVKKLAVAKSQAKKLQRVRTLVTSEESVQDAQVALNELENRSMGLVQRKIEIVVEKERLDLEVVQIDVEIAEVEVSKDAWKSVLNEPHEEEEEVEEEEEDVEEEGDDEDVEEEEVEEEEEGDVEEEEEQAEEEEEEERAEEEGGEPEPEEERAAWYGEYYAMKWWQQGGDDRGIPMKYTPCVYFFGAPHGCPKGEKCMFSHAEDIFGEEPFSTLISSLSWEIRKEEERQVRKRRQELPHQRHHQEAPMKKMCLQVSSSHAEDAPRRYEEVGRKPPWKMQQEDVPMKYWK